MSLHILLYGFCICLIGVNASSIDFVCIDGTVIPLHQICDGAIHCPDGSDETRSLCYHTICPENMFRCYYGACVQKDVRCDGLYQCVDKSDESKCRRNETCKLSEFECLSHQCISQEKICDGVKDCSDESDENLEICNENQFFCPENTYHCKYGGCVKLHKLCDGFNDCVDGSDESSVICDQNNCLGNHCKKKIFCPPIVSKRLKLKCLESDEKGWVNCSDALPVGTVVYSECEQYYKPARNNHITSIRSICQPDGTWNRKPLICEPECGIATPLATPLILHGWVDKVEQWPWHASLYSLSEGNWTFWCGGSLISEKSILTAHCVWSETAATLKIALGKYFSDYNKRESFTQIYDIVQIVMQPLYQDLIGNYGSDIAILILNTTVQFSRFIKPVCIDWQGNDFILNLHENSLGTIVGMGVTENDTYSTTLRTTRLPVIDSDKCIDAQHRDFKKYITYTTFCAGWQNGTGVCNGDSGGGLVFNSYKDNAWFLQGIVSVSPRRLGTSFCDPNFFTIFTKVGMYIDWIKKIV